MKQNQNDELGRLISLLLDGDIGENEHKKLSDLLKESPTNRKEYLEYIRLESLLHWESEALATVATPKEAENVPILYRFPFWIGSAAALFLAISAIWWTDKSVKSDDSLTVLRDPEHTTSVSKNDGDIFVNEQTNKLPSLASRQKDFISSTLPLNSVARQSEKSDRTFPENRFTP